MVSICPYPIYRFPIQEISDYITYKIIFDYIIEEKRPTWI